eukprot:TRINITY_DN47099_c0_g1_i1.p1 TRINITY_DN47099_c0_g1~~TRINITY_DN47099_c0_g1_i1.p1  ORF type:complete len:243 (-),score=6.89 TRINITY_DN47099_c0_g1_i1:290-1018(-)
MLAQPRGAPDLFDHDIDHDIHLACEREVATRGLTPRSSSSCRSCVSFISAAPAPHSTCRCYLPETLFQLSSGQHVPACQLSEHTHVTSADGGVTRVMRITVLQPTDRELVELRTESGAALVVTASHKVAQPENRSAIAGAMKLDDVILCSSGSERLAHVAKFVRTVGVVEIIFHPNVPVETFLPPMDVILTFGSSPQSQDVAVPSHNSRTSKLRRGGMRLRGRSRREQDDRNSVPDTHDSWW